MNKSLYLEGARLIDGTGADPQEDMALVVEEGHISAVGPTEAVTPPGESVEVNLSGKTVMPGLIDAHVHLTLPEEFPFHLQWAGRSPAEQVIRAVNAAKRTIEAGFTTVRDVGACNYIDVDLRNGVERGDIDGPRVLASGPGICQSGGHGNYEPPWLTLPAGSISQSADSREGVRIAVRERLERHVDNIKIFLTGGVSDAAEKLGTREFTNEEIAAIYDEAHAASKPVAAHCMTPDPAHRAFALGLNGEYGDTLEHGIFFHRDETVFEKMVDNDVPLIPTLSVYRRMAEGLDGDMPRGPALNAEDSRDDHVKSIRAAIDHGVTIVAGTDMGGPRAYHGDNALELQELVNLGMNEVDAISAATSNAAHALGIDDEVGTVAEGMVADLLITNSNPTDDISALQENETIELVLQGGTPVVGGFEGL